MSRIVPAIAVLSLFYSTTANARPVWLHLRGMYIEVPGAKSGVFICHGSGENCRVLVDIPDVPPPIEHYPTALTCAAVHMMDVTVAGPGEELLRIGSDESCTATYRIEFTYEYDDGTLRDFVIENGPPVR